MGGQGFPRGWAAGRDEDRQRSEFEAGARGPVSRLSAHPSLVLWNGGNENIWGWMAWGWQEKLSDRTRGWTSSTQLVPQVVREWGPARPASVVPPAPPRPDPEAGRQTDRAPAHLGDRHGRGGVGAVPGAAVPRAARWPRARR